MHKGALAYAVILVILIVVAIILIKTSSPSSTLHILPSTTAKSTSTSSTTTTTTNTSSTSTTIIYSSCISSQVNVSIPNGNFSTGTYEFWNVTGLGFGSAPMNITEANQNGTYFSHPWYGYEPQSPFMATTFKPGIVQYSGNLTSSPFKVTEPYLDFKLISPNYAGAYLQILESGKPLATYWFNTYNISSNGSAQSHLINESISLAPFLCKTVQLKAVVKVVGAIQNKYDYLAITDIHLSKINWYTAGTLVNYSLG
ncbi:MAG: hypothetical protein QXL16_01760 [Candidatus Micrarchaeaceae archaeon]